MVRIDKIYFINSEQRADRKEHMKGWLKECVPENKIERIEAVCSEDNAYLKIQSHIKVLEAFIESGHPVCCIFEDDFSPVDRVKFWIYIARVFFVKVDFDLVQFTHDALTSTETEHKFLVKPEHAQVAAGYMITKEFAPTLLEYFKTQTEESYNSDTRVTEESVLSKWFIHVPNLGYQAESSENIMETMHAVFEANM
jgi:GR25 family glycosyltransferase involved in LPS biosynthesis